MPHYTQAYLISFIRNTFLNSHKFQQDNDLKHTSHYAQMFFAENQINWWKSPPESPDANLIENLWHELKVSVHVLKKIIHAHTHKHPWCSYETVHNPQEFLHREVKPTTKDELVNGIL